MIPSTPTFLYRLTSKNGVLSPLRFLLCTKRSCLITDNVRDRQQVSSERHGRHSPYAVPGPNSLPDSIMDCPSNSWLFIRVGAFFSSFSYTNSSSRTSADDSVQTQSWSHKTCVGKNQQPLSSRNFFFFPRIYSCACGGIEDKCIRPGTTRRSVCLASDGVRTTVRRHHSARPTAEATQTPPPPPILSLQSFLDQILF